MSAADEVAAGLVPQLASELVEKIPVQGDDVLASDLADAGVPIEAGETLSNEEATVAQTEVEQETVDLPNFSPDVPDDLLMELDEPDWEAEAETEVSSDEDEYTYDEQDTEERKRRIAAEKRAAWLETRLKKQNRGKWEAEAKKYFPLAEHALGNIKADSRRAFLKAAKAQHEAVLPYVKPLVERLTSATEQAKQQAKAEGRDEAQAAWGRPTTGPGVVPVAASAADAELEAARKTGNLQKIIGVLMKQGG